MLIILWLRGSEKDLPPGVSLHQKLAGIKAVAVLLNQAWLLNIAHMLKYSKLVIEREKLYNNRRMGLCVCRSRQHLSNINIIPA